MDAHRVEFLGLPNCYTISNGEAEVTVATDIGPRIVGYALAGGESVLGAAPGAGKRTDLGEWRPWAGHRLWAAPEALPRSYVPDNNPVSFDVDGGEVRLTRDVEPETGLQKEMIVSLANGGSEVRVRHLLINRGLWPLDLAPWAITVMRGGGTVVIPQEPYAPHGDDTLLPSRMMALWPYTDLGDPRFSFSRGFTRVRSMPERDAAIKLGVSNRHEWAAYAVGDSVFVKRYRFEEGATYPDGGCNTETFIAGSYVELETVAPLRRLEPGATAEHVEHWYLFGGVDVGDTDEEIAAALNPLVAKTISV